MLFISCPRSGVDVDGSEEYEDGYAGGGGNVVMVVVCYSNG